MRPHRQILVNNFVERLTFDIRIPIRREIDASSVQLHCYTNMTVWEMKAIVSAHIDATPLALTFKRSDVKLMDMKEASNMKLLSDLRVTEGETVVVDRDRTNHIVEVPLIDKRKEVAPELNSIFVSWYHRFSKDMR